MCIRDRQYCALTAGVTLPAYYAGFWLQQRSTRLGAFVRWLTFHSPDVTFTFTLSRNLAITLMNYPRLFFGGTAHVLQFFGPFMLVTLLVLAVALAALLNRTLRHRNELRLLRLRLEPTLPLLVAVVWLAAYVVSVSYTHLDVYKRQRPSLCCSRAGRPGLQAAFIMCTMRCV